MCGVGVLLFVVVVGGVVFVVGVVVVCVCLCVCCLFGCLFVCLCLLFFLLVGGCAGVVVWLSGCVGGGGYGGVVWERVWDDGGGCFMSSSSDWETELTSAVDIAVCSATAFGVFVDPPRKTA